MLRWIFDDPKLDDFTRMENTPFGSAKGISAQIIADAKFDASGNAMASNIITNGEKYMASGKAADEQKLNYKVNIIRNSDAVVEGAFSSKATVVLDYL
jgi:type 1 fimbria pilin